MKLIIQKNPNPQEFAEISEAVKINEGYCPCLLNKNEDTKCMCKDFRNSNEVDFCHCGRYYKVKDCEIVTLVGMTTQNEQAERFTQWEEMLEKQNFIVIPVRFSEYNVFHLTNSHADLCKTKIAKSEVVILLDDEPSSWLLEMETWAEMLNKKIIHWSDLTK